MKKQRWVPINGLGNNVITTTISYEIIFVYNILLGFSLSKYVGYIDPASLTVIIAMIVGAFVGMGMTLKIYWLKVKQKLFHKK